MINDVRRFFISWWFAGGLINRYRLRARGPVADGGLFLAFRLHIGGGLGRSVEVKGALIVVPHDEVARHQQILNRATVAAVGDAERLLNSNGTEGQMEAVLVAAQI